MKNTISLVLVLALSLASASLGAGDTWTQKADMPTARLGVTTSVVNGKIYAIGGYAAANNPGMQTVEEYDPVTDTWTTKANMPTGRRWLSSSEVNGKIYAFGGFTNFGQPGLSTLEEYDPATDTWTTKAPMPTARLGLATSVVDGIIYAIGGSPRGYQMLGTVEAYDPLTDTWTTKADMSIARKGLSTSVVDGKIYGFGGTIAAGPDSISTVEEYDPTTDTWTTKAPMPTARQSLGTSMVDGEIYAIGGFTNATFSTVEAYDPLTDTWVRKTDMPEKKWGLGTSVVDGKIYAIGGAATTSGGHPGVRTVYEYDPNPLVVDFNGDGIVDGADISMMVDYWHTDEPFFDIAPAPFGDGIVDVQDLVVLSEYLLTYPGAVAYWKLDGVEGEIAHDCIGIYDGVLNGAPTWQPTDGAVDGALLFDSIDDYVSTPFVLNPADGKFSVFAWIKGGAPDQVILSQAGGARWLCADPSDGNLMTELKGTGRGANELLSQTVITDGNWHRIGLVWDGSHRTLYVDGVAVAEDEQTDLEASENGLYIGTGKAMEPGTYWSGLIDDVRIYNRAVIP